MRYKKTLVAGIILLILSLNTIAQTNGNKIIINNLKVLPTLPAHIPDWNSMPDPIHFTSISDLPDSVPHFRLVVQIWQQDQKICGNNPVSGLIIQSVRNTRFTISDVSLALANCPDLVPGSYSICFQFFDEQEGALSLPACQDFQVAASIPIPYTPPLLITPQPNHSFTETELQQPVLFSWTALSPAKTGVQYRLRIWQLLSGQSMDQAIQNNPPIITSPLIDGTQTSISKILSGNCTAPANCTYAWNVQALSTEEIPIAVSAPAIFIATQYIIRIDSIRVNCTSPPGIYSFSYTVVNPNAGPAKLTNLVVTSSTPAGAALITYTPPLLSTIVAGGVMTITGTLSASTTLSSICIGAEITDVANTFWKASRDTCIPVSPCRCTACDDNKLSINIPASNNIIINANNTLSLNQPISITTTPLKLVKSIRAELQYFEFVPESDDCMPCNKDSKTYGNLDNGTLATVNALGGGSHSLIWNFIPNKNFSTSNTANVVITIPPTVKCCGATIRWCIRYVITFSDCSVCNRLVCYEKKKDGCGAVINPNPINN